MPRIKTAVHYEDTDEVKVFDSNDKEIPNLEGKYADVKTKILRDALPDTEFGVAPKAGEKHKKIKRELF